MMPPVNRKNFVVVDTKGACMFCLEKNVLDGDLITSSLRNPPLYGTAFSLKGLCRFLNLDLSTIFNNATVPAVTNWRDLEVSVQCCQECSLLMKEFIDLYREYDRIQVQLNRCVLKVTEFMERANSEEEVQLEFRRRMVDKTGNPRGHFLPGGLVSVGIVVVDILRRDLLTKCKNQIELRRKTIESYPAKSKTVQSGPKRFKKDNEGNQGATSSGEKKAIESTTTVPTTSMNVDIVTQPLTPSANGVDTVTQPNLTSSANVDIVTQPNLVVQISKKKGEVTAKSGSEKCTSASSPSSSSLEVEEIIILDDDSEPQNPQCASETSEVVLVGDHDESRSDGGSGSGSWSYLSPQHAEERETTFYTLENDPLSETLEEGVPKIVGTSSIAAAAAIPQRRDSDTSNSIIPVRQDLKNRVTCPLCHNDWLSPGNFDSHMNSHRSQARKTYSLMQCYSCHLKFKCKPSLLRHNYLCHRDKIFGNFKDPNVSDEQFIQAMDHVLSHSILCSPFQRTSCKLCTAWFTDERDCECHVLQVHCALFSKELTKYQRTVPMFSQHAIDESRVINNMVAAASVGSPSPLLVSLISTPPASHMSFLATPTSTTSTSPLPNAKPKCDMCNATFSSHTALERHKATFHRQVVQSTSTSKNPKVPVESLECVHCRKSFENKSAYRRHLFASHRFEVFRLYLPERDIPNLTPAKFDAVLPSVLEPLIKRPQTSTTNNITPQVGPNICTLCSKTFLSSHPEELEGHILMVHLKTVVEHLTSALNSFNEKTEASSSSSQSRHLTLTQNMDHKIEVDPDVITVKEEDEDMGQLILGV